MSHFGVVICNKFRDVRIAKLYNSIIKNLTLRNWPIPWPLPPGSQKDCCNIIVVLSVNHYDEF